MKKLIRLTTHSNTLELLKGQLGFLRREMDVIIVAKDTGNLRRLAIDEGVQYRDIDMYREISLVNDLQSLWALIRLFRQERPDIVHANTPKGAFLAMTAAWITRVPHRIYNINGLRFETVTGNYRRLLIMMERLTCVFANKVIPQGKGVAEIVRRERITNKSLEVIHNGSGNGVDTERFDPELSDIKKQSKKIRGDFRNLSFLFVGRIVGDKGINELVEAFDRLSKEFSDVRLNLVGLYEKNLDPIRPSTLDIIRSNTRIIEYGQQRDVRPFYSASDIFVLPSYREGFPNVVMEAGAMGLPCIVTDISGCNEIIIPGRNGIIIPKQNVDALYNAMRQCIESPERVVAMSKEARPLIISRYRQQDVWEATLAMYNSLK